MKEQFSVVIAEDYTILREGIKSLLSSNPDLKVVGEAGDGLEAVRAVRNLSPDLVLMDLSMPRMTGVDAIKEIKRIRPETRIIVLTARSAEEYIFESLHAGADGYLLKHASSTELLTAIRHVLDGHRYLTPVISDTIINSLLIGKKEELPVQSKWERVTQRERQVLKLVAEGHRNKEIADFLCISCKTVEKHRSNLREKLNLHNTVSLAALAAEKGLISN
jgi:DNA-binding NarL/FixJ family response regulator